MIFNIHLDQYMDRKGLEEYGDNMQANRTSYYVNPVAVDKVHGRTYFSTDLFFD